MLPNIQRNLLRAIIQNKEFILNRIQLNKTNNEFEEFLTNFLMSIISDQNPYK